MVGLAGFTDTFRRFRKLERGRIGIMLPTGSGAALVQWIADGRTHSCDDQLLHGREKELSLCARQM